MALNNVTVTFAPGLPGECTQSALSALTARLTELVSAQVTATGNTSFYNFGDIEPSPENRIYPWLRTSLGFPVAWYVYKDGAWRQVNPSHIWYCGSTAGAANTYTATTVNTYPSTTTLTVGDVFIANINVTNTGATTLLINGIAAAAATDGITALSAGQLVANKSYQFMWDGTRFRVLNPTDAAPETTTAALYVYQLAAGTAPGVINAGSTTIPFGTTLQTQSWAGTMAAGVVTIQPGTYLITATLAIADVAGISGGEGHLVIQNGSTDLNWQDYNINNVDDTVVVTCMAVLTVAPATTASISALIFLGAGGEARYGVCEIGGRAERPASLTILRLT